MLISHVSVPQPMEEEEEEEVEVEIKVWRDGCSQTLDRQRK